MANALQMEANYPEAVRYYKKVLEAEANNVSALQNLLKIAKVNKWDDLQIEYEKRLKKAIEKNSRTIRQAETYAEYINNKDNLLEK